MPRYVGCNSTRLVAEQCQQKCCFMPDPKIKYIVIFYSTVSTEPTAWWELFLVPPAEALLGYSCSLNGPSLEHKACSAIPDKI